jgi:hypothetical protein
MGSQLGGTTTTGGVSFPGLFHAWGKQVIAGIGWELVQAAVRLDGGTWPDFSRVPARHWQHQVRINGPLYAALAEEACLQAGVSLAYYQFPCLPSPRKTDGCWSGRQGPALPDRLSATDRLHGRRRRGGAGGFSSGCAKTPRNRGR